MNVNDEVTVTLTKYGKEVLVEHYVKHGETGNTIMELRHISNDIYCFPLWELMYIFGKYTYMGGKQVFYDNNIKLDTE